MEEKEKLLRGTKFSENYAIALLYPSNEKNLKIFEEMKKRGWELMSISWSDAVFKRVGVKNNVRNKKE